MGGSGALPLKAGRQEASALVCMSWTPDLSLPFGKRQNPLRMIHEGTNLAAFQPCILVPGNKDSI